MIPPGEVTTWMSISARAGNAAAAAISAAAAKRAEMPGHCTNSTSGALSQPVTDASGRKIAAAAAWTSSAVTS